MSDKLTATSRGNGYYKFPDGLMLCWGQDALSTSSQAKYVNFQQAFVSSPQLIAGWSFNANENIGGDNRSVENVQGYKRKLLFHHRWGVTIHNVWEIVLQLACDRPLEVNQCHEKWQIQ